MDRTATASRVVRYLLPILVTGAGVACQVEPDGASSERPAAARILPTEVNIIVDASVSMQGYFTGQTELKEDVAKIVSALDKLVQSDEGLARVAFLYPNDSGTGLVDSGLEPQGFIRNLLDGRMLGGQGSLLHEVLTRTVQETGPTATSIVITDSIMSYSNEEVSANPEINKENMVGLAAQATLALNTARQAGQTLVILGLESAFNGNYYTYKNDRIPCCTAKRPYYAWMLGASDRVRGLKAALVEEGFTFAYEIDFAAPHQTLRPAILQYTDRGGTWYRDPGDPSRIVDVEVRNGSEPVQFVFGADLSAYSTAMQDPRFLLERLQVETAGLVADDWTVMRLDDFEGIDQRDLEFASGMTHLFRVAVTSMVAAEATVTFVMPEILPVWYEDWSNVDDTDAASRDGTTFGLKAFVDAAQSAYRRSEPWFRIEVALER